MNKDFLIVLGEWHDDLHYPTREGIPDGVFRSRFITSKSPFFPFDIFCTHFSPFVFVIELIFDLCHFFFWQCFFCFPNGFVDKHATVPNFNLINQPNLDKILKVEVFVHNDSQLRAAHLILGYNLLSSSFQASKCVIKAKDPHLHLINVIVPGFLNPGPGPQGVLKVEPFL